MGRYRQLIATIVLHGNNVSRVMPLRTPMLDGIALNQPEWQILEYLLENEQDDECMNRISERLGIPQRSAFFLTETRTVPNAASFAFQKKSLPKKALHR